MKLGTQTASLVNHLYSREVIGEPVPVVGMAATTLHWSDRHACTVVAVEKGIVSVRRDKATRVDNLGMSDSQSYTYESDPAGFLSTFKKNRDGQWRECWKNENGRYVFSGCSTGLRLGEREEHFDFTF